MSETAGSVAYTFMKEMAVRRSNDDLLNRSRRTLRGASHNGVCILVIACGLVGFLTSTAGAMVLDKGTVEKTLKSPGPSERKLADLLGEDTDTNKLVDILKKVLVEWKTPDSKVSEADVKELERLLKALENPTPDTFPPGLMEPFYCYYVNDPALRELNHKKDDRDGLTNIKCDSKIDAYAYAAYWMNRSNRCWRLLENVRYIKGFQFRTSVQEYLEYHQGKEACVKASHPRCQLAYCWGVDDRNGIAFRAAVEFAAGAGTGLGFEDHNSVGFTLSGSLGARLFALEDKIDLRFGFGIAAIPIGEASADMTAARKSRSAFMLSPGIGFFNGLFAVSGIFLFDPGGHDRAGKGLALTLDIVAIKNISGAN